MDKVEKSRQVSRAVWVTPTLSELGVGQTLNGPFPWTEEVFDSQGKPVAHS